MTTIEIVTTAISVVSALAAGGAWKAAFDQARSSEAQLQLAKQQQFNAAAAAFRGEFAALQTALRQNRRTNDTDVMNLFTQEVVLAQQEAKVRFEPYLTHEERSRLEQRWQAYLNVRRSPSPGNVAQRRDDTDRMLIVIEEMLVVAKPR